MATEAVADSEQDTTPAPIDVDLLDDVHDHQACTWCQPLPWEPLEVKIAACGRRFVVREPVTGRHPVPSNFCPECLAITLAKQACHMGCGGRFS